MQGGRHRKCALWPTGRASTRGQLGSEELKVKRQTLFSLDILEECDFYVTSCLQK